MNYSDYYDGDFQLRLAPLGLSFYLIAHGVLVACVLIGNTVVIVTITTRRFKKTPNSRFLCSLAIADLLTGMVGIPITLYARVVISPVTCFSRFRTTFFVPAFMFCTVSVFHLIALTIDRFIAISKPLKYPTIVTKRRCEAIIGFVWITSAAVSVIPAIGGFTDPHQWVCGTENYKANSVTVHSFLIAIFIPVMILSLLIFYGRIFFIAHHHLKTVSLTRSFAMGDTEVTRLETKARLKVTVTAVLIVAIFGICWLPMSVKFFLQTYLEPTDTTQFAYQITAEFLAFANSALNPVIYALRNSEYRATFKRLFLNCCSVNSAQRDESTAIESESRLFKLSWIQTS